MDGASLLCMVSEDGSIELPPEALAILGAGPGMPLCLELEGDAIVLHTVDAACELCGVDRDLLEVKGYYFCRNCADAIARALDKHFAASPRR